MRISLGGYRYRIDNRGLNEALLAVGYTGSYFVRNRVSGIRYYLSGYDDTTNQAQLFQDSGKLGGAGSRWTTPRHIVTNYESLG